MDGMITLKDVCKTYCIGGDTVHALDHANMVIQEGNLSASSDLPEVENPL